jgi:hypothetical protein
MKHSEWFYLHWKIKYNEEFGITRISNYINMTAGYHRFKHITVLKIQEVNLCHYAKNMPGIYN